MGLGFPITPSQSKKRKKLGPTRRLESAAASSRLVNWKSCRNEPIKDSETPAFRGLRFRALGFSLSHWDQQADAVLGSQSVSTLTLAHGRQGSTQSTFRHVATESVLGISSSHRPNTKPALQREVVYGIGHWALRVWGYHNKVDDRVWG